MGPRQTEQVKGALLKVDHVLGMFVSLRQLRVYRDSLRVYRELKREIGFEEYLEYVKGAPSRLFLKFRSGTHAMGCLRSWLGIRGWVTGVS